MATTGFEIPGYGTVMVCVGSSQNPGCLLQAAINRGCGMPGDMAVLREQIIEQEKKLNALSIALHRKKETEPTLQVVSVDEIKNWLAERGAIEMSLTGGGES